MSGENPITEVELLAAVSAELGNSQYLQQTSHPNAAIQYVLDVAGNVVAVFSELNLDGLQGRFSKVRLEELRPMVRSGVECLLKAVHPFESSPAGSIVA